MSLQSIRTALQTQLQNTLGPLSIAWENEAFRPVSGQPYAAAFLLPAEPDNIEIGPGFVEQGLFQVNLFYPQGGGPGAATDKAEMIRAAFRRGASFVDAPELNGDIHFDDPAYWLISGGMSVAGGKLVGNGADGFAWHNPQPLIRPGHSYAYRFTVSGYSGGSVVAYVGTARAESAPASANGTFSGTLIATSANEFGFRSAAFAGSIDDFSLTDVSKAVTVNIIKTPEIGPARPEDDRFMVPVKTRWSAFIGG